MNERGALRGTAVLVRVGPVLGAEGMILPDGARAARRGVRRGDAFPVPLVLDD